jgi:CubicO group peptidase (beta-lactamase class C family)
MPLKFNATRVMRTVRLITFGLVPILFLAHRAIASTNLPKDFESQVEALFAVSVHDNTPGGQVLVARNGAILFEKSYGAAKLDSRASFTGDTRFRIGSITKQFTAAAILKLAEQGKLRVDDPVSRFIPDWPRGDEVKLRHLLSHSSGIHNFTAKPGFQAHVRSPIGLAELVESFKHDPYDFNPGDKYNYSNSGYVLLGLIVEKVSGESYETYLRKTFFEPLGMKDTGVYPTGGNLPNAAFGYSYENGKLQRAVDWDMSNVGPAGELYSTAHDLFRWNEALFSQKVISANSMRAAFSVGTLKDDDPTHPEDIGYGFGWTMDRLNGAREISHGGELDGFGSYLLRLPDYQLTVIVLLNCVPQLPHVQQWVLDRQIARLALKGELPPDEQPKIAHVSPGDLQAVVGTYDMGGGLKMTVTLNNGHVLASIAGRKSFEIVPKSDRDFFVQSGNAVATFVRNVDNRVVKAILRQSGDRIDAPRITDAADHH